MTYAMFLATEGGRRCPQCGRFAKPKELGNLSFTTKGGVRALIVRFGHLPGYGCNTTSAQRHGSPPASSS